MNGHTLEIHCEQIEVTSNVPYPDPNWRFTDTAGHEHALTDGGYPTLRWIVDVPEHTQMEDGYLEEYPEQGHYECASCGEEILPGTTVDMSRRYIPGLIECYLDGQPITRAEAEAYIAAARTGH